MALIVLGLDCADPDLVFHRFAGELPNLTALRNESAWGRLRSVDPPITVPAWAAMATGRDPGTLGLYGFRNRVPGTYRLEVATSAAVPPATLWDRLDRAGGRTCVIGVPPMYPPRRLSKGISFGCFLTPPGRRGFAHPPEVETKFRRRFGMYLPDARGFRTPDKGPLRERLFEVGRQRWDMAEWLLFEEGPWDLFWMVDMGIDRVHHGFWRYFDENHPRFETSPWADVIPEYYREVDRRIGRILERLDDASSVLVVSDHGIQPMHGGVAINDWLRRSGYLRLRTEPDAPRRPTPEDVDWSRTRAWGEGGYYGRVFLNRKGREPHGVVEETEVEGLLAELAAGLREVVPGTVVHRPEDLYHEVRGLPPDLLVYFGNLARRSVATVGNASVLVEENDTGPDEANHDFDGIYLLRTPGGPTGRRDRRLLETAPLLSEVLGLPPSQQVGGAA